MGFIADTLTDTDAGVTNPDGEIQTYIRVTSKNLLAALVGGFADYRRRCH